MARVAGRGPRSRAGGGLGNDDDATLAGSADRVDSLLELRTRANAEFFEAEAERLASCCHLMAERFARGGRLLAVGQSPRRDPTCATWPSSSSIR